MSDQFLTILCFKLYSYEPSKWTLWDVKIEWFGKEAYSNA